MSDGARNATPTLKTLSAPGVNRPQSNGTRPHQGGGMNGRTPLKAFIDGIRKEEIPQPKPTKKAA